MPPLARGGPTVREIVAYLVVLAVIVAAAVVFLTIMAPVHRAAAA
jgi:hypothetical protein